MSINSSFVLLLLVITFLTIIPIHGEIHRTKSPSAQQKNQRSNLYVAKQTADDVANSHANMENLDTWIYAILGSILVGSCGIFPLFLIPIEAGPALKHGAPALRLKLFLSFAVGGLLGDVFLHLLPEAWNHLESGGGGHNHEGHMKIGLWVLAGIVSFLVIEKMFAGEGEFDHIKDECEVKTSENGFTKTPTPDSSDSQVRQRKSSAVKSAPEIKVNKGESTPENIKVSGYLNLLANVIDNFTHGLAIAGSFLVSNKIGFITTIAILVHEIPHEVGDFAILLRSGFDKWKAAKAQVLTASGGLVGTLCALTAESAQAAGEKTAWILPFTSGGFIYIALVTVVPDLLEEKHGWESFKQILCICAGIASMGLVCLLH